MYVPMNFFRLWVIIGLAAQMLAIDICLHVTRLVPSNLITVARQLVFVIRYCKSHSHVCYTGAEVKV